ncbi:unnamed protein product, partial [Owenia fusiformis]
MQKLKVFLFLSFSGIVLTLWIDQLFKNDSTKILWDKSDISIKCFNNYRDQAYQNYKSTSWNYNRTNLRDNSTNLRNNCTTDGAIWINSSQSRNSTNQSNNSATQSNNSANKGTNTQNDKTEINFSRDISSRHFYIERENPTSVPNVVHYIWFGKRNFEFLNALSVYSAYRFINPFEIIFHGDTVPSGKWWNFVLRNTKRVRFVHTLKPLRVYGKKLVHVEHSADILR